MIGDIWRKGTYSEQIIFVGIEEFSATGSTSQPLSAARMHQKLWWLQTPEEYVEPDRGYGLYRLGSINPQHESWGTKVANLLCLYPNILKKRADPVPEAPTRVGSGEGKNRGKPSPRKICGEAASNPRPGDSVRQLSPLHQACPSLYPNILYMRILRPEVSPWKWIWLRFVAITYRIEMPTC